MYVLALSDYKIFKACCCRGLQTRPPQLGRLIAVYQPILPTRCVMGPLKYNETFKHSIVFIYICIINHLTQIK